MAQATARMSTTPLAWPVRFTSQAFYVVRRWPVIPAIILTTLFVAAIFAPMLAPYSYREGVVPARLAPPYLWDKQWYEERPRIEQRFWLGADHSGRDILSRIIHGARVSLLVAGVSLTSGLIVGTALGVLAGYAGRQIDEIVMRLVDVWFALPFILVALLVNITIGSSMLIVMGLLALAAWSGFVRNVRAEILSLKTRDYVNLARIAGASHMRIIFRHILPQVFNTIIVIATLSVGGLILAEASLSFLGAGIPPPTPAWGTMVSEGREHLERAWWAATFPGTAIFLVVMALNFLGDWMRDRFDPRLRQI